MRIGRVVFVFIIAVLLFSCEKRVEYEKNIPVNTYGWELHDTISYSVDIEDIDKSYDLYVNIRHRDIYRYMNIYVRMVTVFPDGYEKNEVISLPLCDESGKWYGKCAGDICAQRLMVMKRAKFDKKGKYTFKISHEMRVNELKGILDVGIMLTEHKKKEYVREE